MIPSLVLNQLKVKYGDKLDLPSHIDLLVKDGSQWEGTEHDLQKNFFRYLATRQLEDHLLFLAHAIPNGGKRDKITSANLAAEGVKAGVLDVFIPIPKYKRNTSYPDIPYHGLYIEFKAGKNKPTEEQRAFALALHEQNYKVIVVNCLDIAIKEFEAYYD